MAKELDLGKDMGSIVIGLRGYYEAILQEMSNDIWKVLIEKAKAEAYDKIKTTSKGEESEHT